MINIKDKLIEYRRVTEEMKNLGNEVFDILKRTTLEHYEHGVSIKELLTNKFINDHCYFLGTSYLNYAEPEKLQKEFEGFAIKQLNSDDKFMVFDNNEIILAEIHSIPTTRKAVVNKTWTFNEQGHLVYKYSGTTINGFGTTEKSISQAITINIDNLEIIDYIATKRNYTLYKSFDTNFLESVINKAKQNKILKHEIN